MTVSKTKLTENKGEVLWRIFIVMILMLLGSFAVVFRIWGLQNIEGAKLRKEAEEMHITLRPVKAARGNILADDAKSLMATSLPFYQLNWDLTIVERDSFLKYLDTISNGLSIIMEDEYTVSTLRDKLIRAMEAKDKYFLIKRNVSYTELEKIKKLPLFNTKKKMKSGLIITEASKRQYPFKMLAHRTIGYNRVVENNKKNKDTLQVGLEGYWNDVLAGEEGKMWMQQLSKDVWVPVEDITKVEPRAGKDIVTSININIQDVTEKALLDAITSFDADHGCAIVMEVKTGQIKAIANIGFNEERTQYWEDFNYAVGENIEPGSTFKLASMISLLEDGYVKLTDTVNLNKGKWKFYDATLEDSSPHGLYQTTLERIFEMSSNVGIARTVH